LGFIIICYDDNPFDANDPPVIAVQLPVIIYQAGKKLLLIKTDDESINLPLVNKPLLLTRAPPSAYF
jgi:hypothetical protein